MTMTNRGWGTSMDELTESIEEHLLDIGGTPSGGLSSLATTAVRFGEKIPTQLTGDLFGDAWIARLESAAANRHVVTVKYRIESDD